MIDLDENQLNRLGVYDVTVYGSLERGCRVRVQEGFWQHEYGRIVRIQVDDSSAERRAVNVLVRLERNGNPHVVFGHEALARELVYSGKR